MIKINVWSLEHSVINIAENLILFTWSLKFYNIESTLIFFTEYVELKQFESLKKQANGHFYVSFFWLFQSIRRPLGVKTIAAIVCNFADCVCI